MTNIKNIFSITLFLLSSFNIPAQKTSNLTGTWELVEQPNTMGIELLFTDDNTVFLLTTLKADYNYSFKKNQITYSFTNPNTQKFIKNKMNVIIRKDTMFRIKDQKDTILMLKTNSKVSSQNADNSLLGKWKWKYPTGDTAITEFTKDKMLFRMVTDRKKGTYQVSNNRLFLSIKGIVNDKYKFMFKDKALIINGFPQKGDNLFRENNNRY